VAAGSPALPNTGALVKVNRDGAFTVVIDGLNQPTSLDAWVRPLVPVPLLIRRS
jgi:hypothetical protein